MPPSGFRGLSLAEVLRVICQRFWLMAGGLLLVGGITALKMHTDVRPSFKATKQLLMQSQTVQDPVLRVRAPASLLEAAPRVLPARVLAARRLQLVEELSRRRGIRIDRTQLREALEVDVLWEGRVLRLTCTRPNAQNAETILEILFGILQNEFVGLEFEHQERVAGQLEEEVDALERKQAESRARIMTHVNAILPADQVVTSAKEALAADPAQVADRLQERIRTLAEERAELQKELLREQKTANALKARLETPGEIHVVETEEVQVPTESGRRLRSERNTLMEDLQAQLETSTEQHPFVRRMRDRLEILDRKISAVGTRTEIRKTRKPHPDLPRWQEQLQTRQQRLQDLRDRLDALRAAQAEARKRAIRIPEHLQAIRLARQEIDALQDQKKTLTSALRRIANRRDEGRTIWTQAEVHRATRVKAMHLPPPLDQTLLWSIAAGLAAALVLAIIAEWTDTTIKSAEDARRHFRVPVLGAVPEFQLQRAGRSPGGVLGRIRTLAGKTHERASGRLRQRRQIVERKSLVNLRRVGLIAAVLLAITLIVGYYADLSGLERRMRSLWKTVASRFQGDEESGESISAQPADGEEEAAPQPIPGGTDER